MSDYTTEEIDEIKRSNNIQGRKISELQEYILLLEKTIGIHKTGAKIVSRTERELKDLIKEKEEKEQKASATKLTIAEEVDLIETKVAKVSEKAV
jgi:hypothetical protein